jgi:hypothetical protein
LMIISFHATWMANDPPIKPTPTMAILFLCIINLSFRS